jgi:hypothetical protein
MEGGAMGTARDPIRGSTIRWSYDDGPMSGKTFEHVFAPDGMVTWREIGDNGGGKEPSAHYEVAKITADVYAVAYLADSGFTLTTILDFDEGTAVSFASNERQLFVQRGSFEPMKTPA